MMKRLGLGIECGLILHGIRTEGQPTLDDGAKYGVVLLLSIELAQGECVCYVG